MYSRNTGWINSHHTQKRWGGGGVTVRRRGGGGGEEGGGVEEKKRGLFVETASLHKDLSDLKRLLRSGKGIANSIQPKYCIL